ncbi:MAG: hypothetical protein JO080_05470 [Mucilaginibacter sp.]|nr:hypothetical protein [Mucilaginibacter sp.]
MKPKILLRIAAILILIHCVLHTYGFNTWKEAPDPIYKSVVDGMTGHQFPFMGATRTLGNFYEGFGYASSIALFLIAIVLWLVSGETSRGANLAKKIIYAVGIALVAWGIDEIVYFFPFAAAITLTAAVLTLLSAFVMKKNDQFN